VGDLIFEKCQSELEVFYTDSAALIITQQFA
jgi:hypothetical protein